MSAPDFNPVSAVPSRDVVVLGGGIAGIAATLDLLDAGCQVTLIETRGFLGGRAFSFTDRGAGWPLDNGQHVFIGCCTQFLDFLTRIGARDRWVLQERLRIPVLSRRGRAGRLAGSRLPSPLHLLPSFLTYPHLGAIDKMRVLAGMVRARLTNRTNPRLERITFYQWLREQGQSERGINNLWNLAVEPTLNDNVRDVSAAMGLMIVQDGMLAGANDANLGYATAELLPSLGEPAQKLLESRGVRLLLGSPVSRIRLAASPDSVPDKVESVELASGRQVTGGQFVSALPFSALQRILPPSTLARSPFSSIGDLQWSPIINLHILYDRPVLQEPFCVLVDSPLQWVFNRSAISGAGRDRGKQLLTISVSAAWEYAGLSREELTQTFVDEMAQVFPAAREAQIESVTVVKQREATFRCLPGANRLRPDPVTPIPNFFLAGEWTNTGWPSTMEGAVRSGYRAAQAVIRSRRSDSYARCA